MHSLLSTSHPNTSEAGWWLMTQEFVFLVATTSIYMTRHWIWWSPFLERNNAFEGFVDPWLFVNVFSVIAAVWRFFRILPPFDVVKLFFVKLSAVICVVSCHLATHFRSNVRTSTASAWRGAQSIQASTSHGWQRRRLSRHRAARAYTPQRNDGGR